MSAMPSASGPMGLSLSTGSGHAQEGNVGMWVTPQGYPSSARAERHVHTAFRGAVDSGDSEHLLFVRGDRPRHGTQLKCRAEALPRRGPQAKWVSEVEWAYTSRSKR